MLTKNSYLKWFYFVFVWLGNEPFAENKLMMDILGELRYNPASFKFAFTGYVLCELIELQINRL